MPTDNRFWPGFKDNPRQRTLAWLEWQRDRGIIYYGPLLQKSVKVSSWEEIKGAVFGFNPCLELFCNGMMGHRWFEEALADPEAQIIVPSQIFNKVSQIAGIRLQVKQYTAWLVDIRSWSIPELGPDEAFQLAALFDICKVGVRPTPGSLGQAMMRRAWYQHQKRSIARPNNACRFDVLEHSTGGRVDYFVRPEQLFIEVHSYDIISAYASVSTRLPAGSAICRFSEPLAADGYTTWFMACRVTIPAGPPAVFGVFAMPANDGTNVYPVGMGQYDTWLWRDEIEACREQGWTVEVQEGWAWRAWTMGLAPWAETMQQLRFNDDELIAKWIKLATVAGIGRFGMPLYRYRLAEEGTVPIKPGDMMLTDSQGETGYVLVRETDIQNNYMSHWFSYILMRCRMVLYRKMQQVHRQGLHILMTNYDEIYIDGALSELDKAVYEQEGITWKHKRLTHVRFPFPRGIISDQKTRLPGIASDDATRRNYLYENFGY